MWKTAPSGWPIKRAYNIIEHQKTAALISQSRCFSIVIPELFGNDFINNRLNIIETGAAYFSGAGSFLYLFQRFCTVTNRIGYHSLRNVITSTYNIIWFH